jgi:hypothetical protein
MFSDSAYSAQLLERSMNTPLLPDSPHLRSGLYILRQRSSGLQENVYVMYWPQDGTWSDNADASVRKNRVTFMRFLASFFPIESTILTLTTKIFDQDRSTDTRAYISRPRQPYRMER